jgi:hypothetical protein
MKIALVCIAKNEDDYIQEWVNYNKKLGFDDIFIYQNDWICQIDEPNLIKIEFNGLNQQTNAYNNFIQNYHNNYDWVAFFDVDEFLVLKKHNNIKEFIMDYDEYSSIGINWVLFGDNDLNSVDNNYEVLSRFTKRQSSINPHIKSIIKLLPNIKMFVHNSDVLWVDTNKNTHTGPFNYGGNDDIAIINHYFCKTKEEFTNKINRGRADSTIKRDMGDFNGHNFNDVEDLSAYNFYNNI